MASAVELDGRIAAAQHALSQVDVKTVTMQADPQSASMAKVIGADQNLIAALSHAIFAISIELGSGVGFWLVFGHGRRQIHDDLAIDRAGARELVVIEETPADVIERFFLEGVRPAIARRTQSLGVWTAYKRWCAERRIDPVSHAKFGKLARWPKERSGGSVWYLDCEPAPQYVCLAPAREPKPFPRLGSATTGTAIM
jgi:hypothetical protein